MKRLKIFCIGLVCSILQFSSVTYSYEVNTTIVKNKLAEPSVNFQAELNGGSNAAYKLPRIRPVTLRDSGRNESLMFIDKTNFRYIGNVGYYIPHLSVSIKPNNPSWPAVFDDPTSFSLHVHKGSIILSDTALEALFNDQVFNYQGTTLKDLKVSTGPNFLSLSGQMYRDEWIPFKMEGGLTLKDGHLLYFTPNKVLVNGVDATKVMKAANVKLSELLKIKAVGAELIGNSVILDTLKVFPPPKLYFIIVDAKLSQKGLTLQFDDGKAPHFPSSIVPSSSHIIVQGGDLKFMRVMPLNVSMQIDSLDPNKDLDFCLYRYREQLVGGKSILTSTGKIHTFFPQPNCNINGG